MNVIYDLISKLKHYDPENNFYLFCEPRGGSTWLAEQLQTISNTAVLWEPLHLKINPLFVDCGFYWQQHIPEEADWPEAKTTFDKVLSGKYLNKYLCEHSKTFDFVTGKSLIVKFCRGSALLPWFVKQYDLKYKPIYFLRHPFSVVSSQIKHRAWRRVVENPNFVIPDNSHRYHEHISDHRNFLESLHTPEEVLVAYWCLNNKPSLESNSDRWLTIYYENLIQNPMDEIDTIFDDWGINKPGAIMDSINKPSRKTNRKDRLLSPEKQLSKWKSAFTDQTISNMLKVLDYFEISHYGNSIYPLKK